MVALISPITRPARRTSNCRASPFASAAIRFSRSAIRRARAAWIAAADASGSGAFPGSRVPMAGGASGAVSAAGGAAAPGGVAGPPGGAAAGAPAVPKGAAPGPPSSSICRWIARRQAFTASGVSASKAASVPVAPADACAADISITTRGMPGARTGTPRGGCGRPAAPAGPGGGGEGRSIPGPPRAPDPDHSKRLAPCGRPVPRAGGGPDAPRPASAAAAACSPAPAPGAALVEANSRRLTRGAASASMAVATFWRFVRARRALSSAPALPATGTRLAPPEAGSSTLMRQSRSTRSPRSAMTHVMRSPISPAIWPACTSTALLSAAADE